MKINTQVAGGFYSVSKSTSKVITTGTNNSVQVKQFAASSCFFSKRETSALSENSASGSNHVETTDAQDLYYRQTNIASPDKITKAEAQPEQVKDLGIGFVFVNNHGYGMSAGQIMNGDSDDVVIRVRITTGESKFEAYDVNLSEVDPSNATAIEMFALCQYADANGTGVKSTWGSWNALKIFSTSFDEIIEYSSFEEVASKKMDWSKALSESKYTLEKQSTGETMSAADVIKMLKDTLIERHKLTKENIKNGDDWRKMTDDQWDKLIEQIDKYIDDIKKAIENAEELQEEAAKKGAAKAPGHRKALAASMAALYAAANGFVGEAFESDERSLEESSWTYELQTNDQVVMATAKMANEFASATLSKAQEMTLTDNTIFGISEVDKDLVDEDEEEKKSKLFFD